MEETEKMEERAKSVCEVVMDKVEEKMNEIMNNEGVTRESVDYLYKLVDIHKDLKNEDYWKEKEEKLDEIRKLQCRIWSRLRKLWRIWCKRKRQTLLWRIWKTWSTWYW